MNRNAIVTLFSVLAVVTVLYWVRVSATEDVSVNAPAAEPASIPSPLSAKEYPAMLASLSKDLNIWNRLHPADQLVAVAAVMDLFVKQNQVKFTKSPEFYVRRLNQTLMTNGEIRAMPLDRVMMILSVMEYDFDNGQDKDELARQILGPDMYKANQERLKLQTNVSSN